MQKIHLIVTVLCLSLYGCGGGGGSSTTTTTTTNSSLPNNQAVNTGSVSANFVAASQTKFLVVQVGRTVSGVGTTPFTQASSGALTTLSQFTLTGSPNATQEISGDATYAMGRWSYGTVTQNGAVIGTMNATTNDFWHYVLFNELATLPTSGTKTCNAGTFTAPSYYGSGYTGAGEPLFLGSSTGVATLSFSAAGANVAVNIITTAGTSSGSVTLDATVTSPTQVVTLAVPSSVTLGDGGNGAVRIVGGYVTTLANGAKYQGVYQFVCS